MSSREWELTRVFGEYSGVIPLVALETRWGILVVVPKKDTRTRKAASLLSAKLGKKVFLMEEVRNAEEFARRFFAEAEPKWVRRKGNQLEIKVSPEKRGIAIGRDGIKVKTASEVCQRLFGSSLRIV